VRSFVLVLSLLCLVSTVGCSKRLGYEGDLDVVVPLSPDVSVHRVLRMRIVDVDGVLSTETRNRLGREIARAVEQRTSFERVYPHSRSKALADEAPLLELEVRRYRVPVVERGWETGLATDGRLYAPDRELMGRFEAEASSDQDSMTFIGSDVGGSNARDPFVLIARRTAGYVADFLNGLEDES